MNEKRVREILKDAIESNGELVDFNNSLHWKPGNNHVILDSYFTAEKLEAIAWWMKNTKKEGEENGKERNSR